MAEPTTPANETVVDGTVERFVFRAEDSGFTVARFVTPGHEHVTIVGELVNVQEGLPLRLRGRWVEDKKWGQFRVSTYQLRTPETILGIERFLGSGIIPGIGPEIAKRMVTAFGMETLEVIDKQPHRLVEVSGIGAARAAKISEAFAGQKHVQDVMVFLRGHGVSAAFENGLLGGRREAERREAEVRRVDRLTERPIAAPGDDDLVVGEREPQAARSVGDHPALVAGELEPHALELLAARLGIHADRSAVLLHRNVVGGIGRLHGSHLLSGRAAPA